MASHVGDARTGGSGRPWITTSIARWGDGLARPRVACRRRPAAARATRSQTRSAW